MDLTALRHQLLAEEAAARAPEASDPEGTQLLVRDPAGRRDRAGRRDPAGRRPPDIEGTQLLFRDADGTRLLYRDLVGREGDRGREEQLFRMIPRYLWLYGSAPRGSGWPVNLKEEK